MDIKKALFRLQENAELIRALAEGIPAEQARWKPSPADWSILETVNHLWDEERLDFRARIAHLLSGSPEPWAPIDPAGWVTARSYNTRDLAESLEGFLTERRESLHWLDTVKTIDGDLAYPLEPLKGLRAGDLLVSWVAHDYLAMRQLVELRYRYNIVQSRPYSVEYAGDW
jgi:hypothetical protein